MEASLQTGSARPMKSKSWPRLTFRSSFVRLRPLAIIVPSRTSTHPTGISAANRASSACKRMAGQLESQTAVGQSGITIFIASSMKKRSAGSCSSGGIITGAIALVGLVTYVVEALVLLGHIDSRKTRKVRERLILAGPQHLEWPLADVLHDMDMCIAARSWEIEEHLRANVVAECS